MPQTDAIIGRIGVKVLPDTTGFKKTLQGQLKKIEKQLGPITLDLDFDKNKVKRDIDDLKRDVDDIDSTIRPSVSQTFRRQAQAILGVLARDRVVNLVPKVSKRAAASAAASLAALSGARSLTKTLDSLFDSLKNLDKNVPIIGTISLAIAGLSSWAATAVSNLFALSSSLAQIGPAALLLPGLFGGLAIGLGASIAVLKDFDKVLPGVKKKFTDLQDQMSIDFWNEAKAPFQRMINSLFPQFARGLTQTSTALGGFFGNLAGSIQREFDGILDGMFDDLNESISISRKYTDNFAGVISTLGRVGAGQLPRLAEWFGSLAETFDKFLAQADKDGRLQEWIDTSIFMMGELGRVLGGFGSIFAGIARAAEAAGGSTLSSLADTLERIAKVVNGPVFQKALSGVFEAAHTAIQAITDTAGPAFNDFILSLSRVLERILPIIGDTLGTAFKAIFEALDQPAVWRGVEAFFKGLQKGVEALAPHLPKIGEAIGALLSTLGTVAEELGPVLGTALEILADALVTLLPSLEPLIKALSEGLVKALETVAPYIDDLVTSFANWLANGGVETLTQLMDELVQLLAQITPSAVDLIKTMAQAIIDMAPAIITIADVAAPLAKLLDAIARFTFSDKLDLGSLGLPEELKPSIDAWNTLAALPDKIKGAWEGFDAWFIENTAGFRNFVKGLFGGGDNKGGGGGSKIAFLDIITRIPKILEGVLPEIDAGIDTIVGYFKNLPGRIKGAFENVEGLLYGVGGAILGSLIDGIVDKTDDLWGVLGAITSQIPDHKGPASKDRVLLYDAGTLIMDGFLNGLESRYDAVKSSLRGLTQDIGNTEVDPISVSSRNARLVGDALTAQGGAAGAGGRTFIYHAAPGSSIDSEEDLFAAVERGRMVDW